MKRSWVGQGVALVALLTGALPAMAQRVDTPVAGTAKVPGTTLSIDDLYRFKSIVGTEPVGYSWAADGSAVLFLWNDEGATFQDIWSFSPKTGRKTRLTFLGRESQPETEAHGIAQAVYLDRGRIAFTLSGQLHIREANGTVAKVEADKQAIRKLAVSPDGTKLAFVSGAPVDPKNRVTLGGVLWVRDVATGATARKLVGDDDPKVYVSDFQWSDDSRAIAFEQDDDRLMPERDILYSLMRRSELIGFIAGPGSVRAPPNSRGARAPRGSAHRQRAEPQSAATAAHPQLQLPSREWGVLQRGH